MLGEFLRRSVSGVIARVLARRVVWIRAWSIVWIRAWSIVWILAGRVAGVRSGTVWAVRVLVPMRGRRSVLPIPVTLPSAIFTLRGSITAPSVTYARHQMRTYFACRCQLLMLSLSNGFLQRVATCAMHFIRQGRTQASDKLPDVFQLVCSKPRIFVKRTQVSGEG